MPLRVRVQDAYSGREWQFEGSESQVEGMILEAFPWLQSPNPEQNGNVIELIEHLSAHQAYLVAVRRSRARATT